MLRLRVPLAFATVLFASLLSAEPIRPSLDRHADPAVWHLHNRAATGVPDQRNALRLDARENDGVAWLAGSDIHEGTIEVVLRGANKPGQSFVGIAFRGADDDTYDAVYFRPFNFAQPDAVRRSRAVQYVSVPKHHWQPLRQQFPGKYEAAIAPVPDPDGWFRARIVLAEGEVSVFVNDATTPCLVVDELSDRRGGRIGLWVGNGSSGDFADLRLTPDE